MARRKRWRRVGSKGRFRYLDDRGRRITDEGALERIRSLAIPPAWTDVRIATGARAKVQATGYDAAGRKQYRYHPDYRARREQEKFDRLILFAERLPTLRATMAEHMQLDGLPVEKVAAIAVRLINHGWFRVGGEQYAKRSRTFGITTLRKSHVEVRGSTISFRYRGKHRRDGANRRRRRGAGQSGSRPAPTAAEHGSSSTRSTASCTSSARGGSTTTSASIWGRNSRRRISGRGAEP